MKHIACSGMGLLLLLGMTGLPAGAQNQAPSASQNSSSGSSSRARRWGTMRGRSARIRAARRSRKCTTTTICRREDKLSVVGQTPATTTVNNGQHRRTARRRRGSQARQRQQVGNASKAATGRKGSVGAATAPEDEANKATADKQWADKIAGQKDQIDLLGRELDVLQREYQIRAAAMYADVGNRMRNSADWDKQDAQYKQQIADKQKALDDAKQKLEDLQEDARKAGRQRRFRASGYKKISVEVRTRRSIFVLAGGSQLAFAALSGDPSRRSATLVQTRVSQPAVLPPRESVAGALFFQAADLFDVMQAVDQVELSPLTCREGAEDGMVEQLAARTQILLALRHDVIHLGNLGSDLGLHFLRARRGDGRPAGPLDRRANNRIPQQRLSDRAAPMMGSVASGFPASATR